MLRWLALALALALLRQLPAQELRLLQPKPGQPLDEEQEILFEVGPTEPQLVELWLNGKLAATRKRPPHRFVIQWNTSLSNRLALVAHWEGLPPVRVEQLFQPFQVDESAQVQAYPLFPLVEGEGEVQVDCGRGKQVSAQPKSARDYRLELVLLLDVSGSMRGMLPRLRQGIEGLLSFAQEQDAELKIFVIDADIRLFEPAPFLQNLQQDRLFREQGESVIYDGIALAAGGFRTSPRRLILLLSDGRDDGSSHKPAELETSLKQNRVGLIWLNPDSLENPRLSALCRRSGGFEKRADPAVFLKLFEMVRQQLVWIQEGSGCELSLRGGRGELYYPRW